jgi:hypothetical protein
MLDNHVAGLKRIHKKRNIRMLLSLFFSVAAVIVIIFLVVLRYKQSEKENIGNLPQISPTPEVGPFAREPEVDSLPLSYFGGETIAPDAVSAGLEKEPETSSLPAPKPKTGAFAPEPSNIRLPQ